MSSETWACGSTLSCQCTRVFLGWCRHASTIFAEYVPFVRLSESCTKGSSTSCACWLTNRSWDTCHNTSQTFLHQLPNFWVDPHCTCFVTWQPRCATDMSTNWRQSFSVAAPRAWNKLPTELKLGSTGSFRRGLKTFQTD